MEMLADVDSLETDDNLTVYGKKIREFSKNEGKELEIDNQAGNTKTEIKKECGLGKIKRELPDWMKVIKKKDDKKQMKQKYVEEDVKEGIKEQCILGKNKRKLLNEGVKVKKKEEYIEEMNEFPVLLPKIEIEKDEEHFDLHKKAKIETQEISKSIREAKFEIKVSSRDVRTGLKDLDFDDVKDNIGFWNFQQNEGGKKNWRVVCPACPWKNLGTKVNICKFPKHVEKIHGSSVYEKMNSAKGALGCPVCGDSKVILTNIQMHIKCMESQRDSRCSSGDEDSKYTYYDCDEEMKMALVVRQDLKLGKGEVANNCCNATLAAYKLGVQNCPQALRAWEANGQPKVILEADNEEVLLSVLGQARSLGLVSAEVAQALASKTVVALGPGPAHLVDQLTGHLKNF